MHCAVNFKPIKDLKYFGILARQIFAMYVRTVELVINNAFFFYNVLLTMHFYAVLNVFGCLHYHLLGLILSTYFSPKWFSRTRLTWIYLPADVV